MDALGYVRISTKDQSLYSLDYQDKSIRDYCARNGLNLLNVYRDNGHSSYTFDRPDWLNLEEFIKKNRAVKYLVIFDYDRFSRNIAEAILKIRELYERFHVKVLSIADPVDLDFDDPMNFMMRAFKLMMGESELWRIRKRSKESKIASSLAGRPSAKAPYGYINGRDAEGKAIMLIDEPRAKVVQKIFDLYHRGYSQVEIKKEVSKDGFTLQGKSAINRVLSNCIYAGFIVGAHSREKKYLKGLHQPIVSQDIFFAVKNKLAEGKKQSSYYTNESMYLKGCLQCWCGKLMTSSNPRGKSGKHYWYYLCYEHKQHYLAKRLHNQFEKIIDAISFSDADMDYFKKTLYRKIDEYYADKKEKIQSLNLKIGNVKRRISDLEQKFLLTDKISVSAYELSITQLNTEKGNYEFELLQLNHDKSDFYFKADRLLENLKSLSSVFFNLNSNRQKEVINYLFGGVLYYEQNTYRTPYPSILIRQKLPFLIEANLLKAGAPFIKINEAPALGDLRGNYQTLSDYFELFRIFAA